MVGYHPHVIGFLAWKCAGQRKMQAVPLLRSAGLDMPDSFLRLLERCQIVREWDPERHPGRPAAERGRAARHAAVTLLPGTSALSQAELRSMQL